ncbi:hypothetical protein PAXRUDRAFT_22477 [Paxillus rubicundulus Ve08.2h10]|uniref:Unplaced genomic scaffold scaffold_6490, whole genome shotgun sequence n=1 Tax=Paxillus rubicundulus Ve08.2h10 TaxID=930991 RepID=A0A0D0C8U1_9AGAM|nr:hypothetical protein PAXRUDRAFT_22477 [Paxillus rubicundulus Ve08.2h10]
MAAKGKRNAAPNDWPMDTEDSKDDCRGPTKEEEPGNVSRQPGAWSKHHDISKQARGRGLDDEGDEEEEADGQRRTWSEVLGDPKDSSKQQARKKVWQRKSDGEDSQDPDFKAKAR